MNKKLLFDLIDELAFSKSKEFEKTNDNIVDLLDELYLAMSNYEIYSIEELIEILNEERIVIKTNKKKGRKKKWTDHFHALLSLEVDILIYADNLSKEDAFKRLSNSVYWKSFIETQEASYCPELYQSIKKQYNNAKKINSAIELYVSYEREFWLKKTSNEKIIYINRLRGSQ